MRRTSEEARRLIIEAAQARIAETGPEGLRLQDIAADAGISHPLILHHFGSREGLVRALTRQAIAELKDKLLAAMMSTEPSLELQLDQVFDAFRGGLAQRLVWLATVDPEGDQTNPSTILRELADTIHARRIAAAPGATVKRADTEALIYLITTAAIGDAMLGAQLRRSAGLPVAGATDRHFRVWLAALIRRHGTGL